MAIGSWLNKKENTYTLTPKTSETHREHSFGGFVSGGLNNKCDLADRFRTAFDKIAAVYPSDFMQRLPFLPQETLELHERASRMPTETLEQIRAWESHWLGMIGMVRLVNMNKEITHT